MKKHYCFIKLYALCIYLFILYPFLFNNVTIGRNLKISDDLCTAVIPESYHQAKLDFPELVNAIETVAEQPIAIWYDDRHDYVVDLVTYAFGNCTDGRRPVIVVYGIPNKDCSAGYSMDGTNRNRSDYINWLETLANIAQSNNVVYILEPDAVGLLSEAKCGKEYDYDRYLKLAINVLTNNNENADVYLDIGFWTLQTKENADKIAKTVRELLQDDKDKDKDKNNVNGRGKNNNNNYKDENKDYDKNKYYKKNKGKDKHNVKNNDKDKDKDKDKKKANVKIRDKNKKKVKDKSNDEDKQEVISAEKVEKRTVQNKYLKSEYTKKRQSRNLMNESIENQKKKKMIETSSGINRKFKNNEKKNKNKNNKLKGIALNTSNYRSNKEMKNACKNFIFSKYVMDYNFKCVIDTSRNYRGPSKNREWCNANNTGIGRLPSKITSNKNYINEEDKLLIDYYLWIKPPGESDGYCNDSTSLTNDALKGPDAGDFFPLFFSILWNNGIFVEKKGMNRLNDSIYENIEYVSNL